MSAKQFQARVHATDHIRLCGTVLPGFFSIMSLRSQKSVKPSNATLGSGILQPSSMVFLILQLDASTLSAYKGYLPIRLRKSGNGYAMQITRTDLYTIAE